MDQDFHYYGTYYAARSGGFNANDATLIAKAANFIDFFTETTYAAYWKLVRDKKPASSYDVVAQLDCPRYTFQGGLFGSGVAPEDGLWCSYHFTPGNYDDPPNSPSRETVHGHEVAGYLPKFKTRETNGGRSVLEKYNGSKVDDLKYGKMLNRPQSALSRVLLVDAIRCATNDARLSAILGYAKGGKEILQRNRADNLRRFRLILLGVRAHVIADTWAHQDHCGLDNVMNTYWDVNYDPDSWNPAKMGYGRQSIDYDDGTTGGWRNQVLSWVEWRGKNFEATPNGTSYLGHGWMGHLPDFSFVKFRYKPCWSSPSTVVERDNPSEYEAAWVELVSLFTQAEGRVQLKLSDRFRAELDKAKRAIRSPCKLEGDGTGRKSSANAWLSIFGDPPSTMIDANAEPDAHAVMDGMVENTTRLDRYGTDYVNVESDLYLFQIAADYHFHFVKHYLEAHQIYRFTGSWSQQTSALSPEVSRLFSSTDDPQRARLELVAAQASSEIAQEYNGKPQTAERLLEGSDNTFWNSDDKGKDPRPWFWVQLDQPSIVQELNIRWKASIGTNGARAMKYRVLSSLDGVAWTDTGRSQADVPNLDSTLDEDKLPGWPAVTRFIKVEMSESSYREGYFTCRGVKAWGMPGQA